MQKIPLSMMRGYFLLNKSTKRLLFLFISLIVMLFSGLAGYLLAQNEPPLVAAEPTEDIAAEADNTRLSADAVITWVYNYEMCRHKISEPAAAGELAGLTFTELRQKYPGARIAAFGSGDAMLELSCLLLPGPFYTQKGRGCFGAVPYACGHRQAGKNSGIPNRCGQPDSGRKRRTYGGACVSGQNGRGELCRKTAKP